MGRTGGVRRARVVPALAAFSLVVSGCSSGPDDAAADAALTSRTASARSGDATVPQEPATQQPPDPATTMTVTFDGSGCGYEGPAELPTGTLTLQYVNRSDGDAGVSMDKLRDGVSAEDLEAVFTGETDDAVGGEDLFDPEQGSIGYVLGPDDEESDYSFYAQPGEWVLSCGPIEPWRPSPRWLAGEVTVTD